MTTNPATTNLRDRVLQALNEIRMPSTAEEITEKLNQRLNKGEKPFHAGAVAQQLRNIEDVSLTLYWLKARPRRSR